MNKQRCGSRYGLHSDIERWRRSTNGFACFVNQKTSRHGGMAVSPRYQISNDVSDIIDDRAGLAQLMRSRGPYLSAEASQLVIIIKVLDELLVTAALSTDRP